MKTSIIHIQDLNEKVLKKLDQQHIPIAFPTETVYGLGAPYDNEATIFNVFVL